MRGASQIAHRQATVGLRRAVTRPPGDILSSLSSCLLDQQRPLGSLIKGATYGRQAANQGTQSTRSRGGWRGSLAAQLGTEAGTPAGGRRHQRREDRSHRQAGPKEPDNGPRSLDAGIELFAIADDENCRQK